MTKNGYGLIVDSMLLRKGLVDWLMYKLGSKVYVNWCTSKLGSAFHAAGAVEPCMSQEPLQMIYLSYFHSLMTYSIILGAVLPIVYIFLGYRRCS